MSPFHRRPLITCSVSLFIIFSFALAQSIIAIEPISDEVMIRDFERYLPELSNIDHETMLEKMFIINRTPPDVQRAILETIYNSIISSNPYKDKVATVRTFNTFTTCQEERATLKKRAAFSKKAIEKLLKKPIADCQLPRIGICLSGGGIRAMVCADGFINGLNKTGILDTALYTSALSGSTWLLAPWITSGKRYEDFADEILVRLSQSILGKPLSAQISDLTSFSTVIVDSFLRRIAFEELPTVIDIYGLMLGLALLSPEEKKQLLHVDLAGQAPHVSEGQTPFPLYSAVYVQHEKKAPSYEWVEFSPFEVACYDQKAAVPSWAYGRRFDKGVSQNAAPSLPLCYLMGIWGSAISVSCGEIFGMIVNKLEPKAFFDSLQEFLDATVIGNIRIFPATISNMTYHFEQSPDELEKAHIIVDAGIPCNLPVPPLLERNLDIVIIGDFSSDSDQLHRAEEYARAHNLHFPKINYEGLMDHTYSVFGNANEDTPIVVYVPLVKNPRYMPNFDPRELMQIGQFMNVTNFSYGLEQSHAVAGLTEFTITEMQELLTKLIAHVVNKKALEPAAVPTPA